MKRTARLLAIGIGLVLLLGTGGMLYLNRAPKPLTEKLPAANGFDDLIEVESAWQVSAESAQNQRYVPMLRSALSKESQMPLAVVREAFRNPPTQASKTVIVGLISLAEGELAAGRWLQATKLWIDALQFSPARVRGGVLIHALIGIGGEKRVLESIEANQSRLPAEGRHELASALRSLDTKWEPVSVICDRDLSLGMELLPVSQRIPQRFAATFLGTLKKVHASVTHKFESEGLRRSELARNLEQ